MIDYLFAGTISALFLALVILSIVASRVSRGSAMLMRESREAHYAAQSDETPPWEEEQTA